MKNLFRSVRMPFYKLGGGRRERGREEGEREEEEREEREEEAFLVPGSD